MQQVLTNVKKKLTLNLKQNLAEVDFYQPH